MILNPLTWDMGAWRLFFLVAGLWNLSGAIPAIVRPEKNLQQFYRIKTGDDVAVTMNRTFWVMVLLFGVGYLAIAYDPVLFYGIIFMGIVGKILVALNWYYQKASGRLQNIGVFAATGDLLFAVLFIFSLFSPAITPCTI
jgi:hypothetical protein